MLKRIAFCLLTTSGIACAGNVPTKVIDEPNSLDDLSIYTMPDGEQVYARDLEEIELQYAKDYNDCMDRADKKNDRDHDRCEKDGRGERCHEQANDQYDKNRESCERVAHSDNVGGAVDSISGGSDRSSSNSGGSSRLGGSHEKGAGSRESGR